MRLARLAVLGLAVGVFAGFAIALLRTRPLVTDPSPPLRSPDPRPTDATRPGDSQGSSPDDAGTTDGIAELDEDATVLDVRNHRRVTG